MGVLRSWSQHYRINLNLLKEPWAKMCNYQLMFCLQPLETNSSFGAVVGILALFLARTVRLSQKSDRDAVVSDAEYNRC